jgi:ABC-type amino acid transport system permease subunit
MVIPVTMVISVGISMTVVEVAMGITIISVAIIIAIAAIAVSTRCDTARQRQTDEKHDTEKKQFLIHAITPFLSPLSI